MQKLKVLRQAVFHGGITYTQGMSFDAEPEVAASLLSKGWVVPCNGSQEETPSRSVKGIKTQMLSAKSSKVNKNCKDC